MRPLLGEALRFDLTELEGLDLLSYPDGPIREAQRLAAAAWGAAHTWFLVNGSTAGIQAAVMATCGGPGDALVLGRNAHLSAFNAAALAGCAPVWAPPARRHGLAHHVTPAALEAAFAGAELRGLRPRAALVVSPTYFGIISDVAGLAEVCARRGAALIVDEAHGAHLRFLEGLPGDPGADGNAAPLPDLGALRAGADLAVQSAHKTLSALTQGAVLHAEGAGRADPGRVSRALQALQTSSPSYLVMASLDAARAQAQDPGAVAAAHAAARHIRAFFDGPDTGEGAAHNTATTTSSSSSSSRTSALEEPHGRPRLRLLTPASLGGAGGAGACVAADPWRFTVLVHEFGCSGWEAAAALEREWGVVPELATAGAVVFAAGMGTSMADAERLRAALAAFAARRAPPRGAAQRPPARAASIGDDDSEEEEEIDIEVVLSPRQALQTGSEAVPAGAAAGRVGAELLCPYPPGVPAIYPGERVTPAALARLRAVLAGGGRVTGAADPSLDTLRVICEADVRAWRRAPSSS